MADKAEKKRLAEEAKAEKKRANDEAKAEKKAEKERLEAFKKAEKERVAAEKKAAKNSPTKGAKTAATPKAEPVVAAPPAAKEPTPPPTPEPTPAAKEPTPPPSPKAARDPTPEPPAAAAERDPTPEPPAAAAERDPTPEPPKQPSPEPERARTFTTSDGYTNDMGAQVEEGSGGLSKTGSMRRQSVQPAVQGVTRIATEDEELPEVPEGNHGDQIIEDDVDRQVGNMNSSDAHFTASYLRDSVDSLRQMMTQYYDNGSNKGYVESYRSMLPVGREQTCNASMREANKLKNRYGNIAAYDHSRVLLPVMNQDPDTDYVNANWVDGYKCSRKYIASQGPVPNSFISFWRMVWHSNVEVISMVTHEVEGGRMKCHRYWPDPTSEPSTKKQRYGDIIVTHIATVPHRQYNVRSFTVEFNGETRKLKQFAYTTWPDHGVPLTTGEMLGYRNAIHHAVTDPAKPLLIHCSAGVGRTGTYIAIDRLMAQVLDAGGPLDFEAVVSDLRRARNFMVQTESQYMFIFRAVLDAITELLNNESRKVKASSVDAQALAAAAADAEAEHQAQLEEEKKLIREAELEVASQQGSSADNAHKVIKVSIKDRMKNLMEDAEKDWMAKYTATLGEWGERNKFDAEDYDLTYALTPVQSRIEALRQKGMLTH